MFTFICPGYSISSSTFFATSLASIVISASVICSGFTSTENKQIVEYTLKLDSNPEFTAGVLVAYARAVYKLSLIKDYGAKTVLDIPPVLLSSKKRDELIEKIL